MSVPQAPFLLLAPCMILARLCLSPIAAKRVEVQQALATLSAMARGEEGCRRCGFFLEGESQRAFELIEEWESREALERHLRSPTFSILLGMEPLLTRPLAMNIYTVASSEGAEAVLKVARRGNDERE